MTEITWATNAPDHWPAVCSDPLPAGSDPSLPINQVFFGARLQEAFASSDRRLAALGRSFMSPDGILMVPFEIEDGDVHRPVFLYGESNEENAGHFAAASALLEQRGLPAPYYFAPEPLATTAPIEGILRPFGPDLLSKTEQEMKPGKYAMWWPSENDNDWDASRVRAAIRETYEGFEFYESYALFFFLKELGLFEEEMGRVALPDDMALLPIEGPEAMPLLLTAGAGKGIRFHFHVETTPPSYLYAFWKLLSEFAERLGDIFREQGVERDPEVAKSPMDWWDFMEETISKMTAKRGPVEAVGVVPLEPPEA